MPGNKVHADINPGINFQTKIVNTDGTNILNSSPSCVVSGTDTCGFRFAICTSSTGDCTGANLLWSETFTNVEIGSTGGILSTVLGNSTAFPADLFENDEIYLEIDFDTDGDSDYEEIFSPRKLITSVPYAFNAKYLDGSDASGFVKLNPATQQSATGSTGALINVNQLGTSDLIHMDVGGSDAFYVTSGGAAYLSSAVYSPNIYGGTATNSVLNLIATSGNGGSSSVINFKVGNNGGTTAMTISNTGLVGIGTATPYATLHNAGSTLYGTTSVSDVSGGGNIGTAAATVDIYTGFNVNQTTASQALTLPSPTNTTAGRIAYVTNVGTASFTMYGVTVGAGNTVSLVWDGDSWNHATGNSGAYILNQFASGQTADFWISGNATIDTGIFTKNYSSASTTAGDFSPMVNTSTLTGVFTSGTVNNYGFSSTATTTGASTGGTISTYAGYFSATGNTNATSRAYGIYAAATGADSNYAGYFVGANTTASYAGYFSGAATGTGLAAVSSGLTTGTALSVSSTNTTYSSGKLLNISKTATSGSTAFTGDIAAITYTHTFNGGAGVNHTGNVLDLSRTITLNTSGNTHTISGSLVKFVDNGVQTAGTLLHTASVLEVTQSYAASTGSAVVFTNGGGGLSFVVNDEASDTTPFVIDANGLLGIGTTAPTAWLDVTAATTSAAQIRLRSSGGTNPTTPNAGDLWFNGTYLYFYDGSSSRDLLGSGYVLLDPAAQQTASGTGVAAISINYLGSGDLIHMDANGTDTFYVTNGGNGYFSNILNVDTTSTVSDASLIVGGGGWFDGTMALNGDVVYTTMALNMGSMMGTGIRGTNFYALLTSATGTIYGDYRELDATGLTQTADQLNYVYGQYNDISLSATGPTGEGDYSGGWGVGIRNLFDFNGSNHYQPVSVGIWNTSTNTNGVYSSMVGMMNGSWSETMTVAGDFVGVDNEVAGSTLWSDNDFTGVYNSFTGYVSSAVGFRSNINIDEVTGGSYMNGFAANLSSSGTSVVAEGLVLSIATYSVDNYGVKVDLGSSSTGTGANYGIYANVTGESSVTSYSLYTSGGYVYHEALMGLGSSATVPTARLDISPSTASAAQIHLRSSGGTPPTSPTAGDLWYNGTNLYFYHNSTSVDLLATGGTPGGSNTYVQYNNSGAFGGEADFTYNSSSNLLYIAGSVMSPIMYGSSTANGTLTLQGNSATSGNTSTNANLQFKVGNSGGTTAMTILNNGNIGIGVTPSYTLDVSGTGRFSGDLRLTGIFYDTSGDAGSSGQVLSSTGTGTNWVNAATGTVTSVGLSMPSQFTVTNSPVTGSGTLTASWASQTQNYVLAAPLGSSGTPTFRALVDSDIPDTITLTNITQIGTRSHSSLQNLSNDDHTQYALLAGRSGGQILIGGTAINDPLRLVSNSVSGNSPYDNAIMFETGDNSLAMRILFNGNVGVGTIPTSQKFQVSGNVYFTGAYYDSGYNAGTSGQVLSSTGTGTNWVNAATGTVTSVGLSMPSQFTVTNSPVTGSGTLTASWASQTQNYVLAAPLGSSGTPTFRALVDSDIPDTITLTNITQIGTRSHSSLQNLSNDDHTQYALLAGRSGGQILIGGTAANNILTLKGNSATSGNTSTNANIQFDVGDTPTTAMIIMNNTAVTVGSTTADYASSGASAKLYTQSTVTDSSSAGIATKITPTTTTTGSLSWFGLKTSIYPNIAGDNSGSSAYGLHSYVVRNNGSGTLGYIYGASINYGHSTSVTGTTSVATGVDLQFFNGGSGTMTTAYDLRIRNASGGGTVGTHWAIYQQESTVPNYLAGSIGLGSTTINEKLSLGGTDPRIYLADATAPSTTANRLYSLSGSLYWNGVNLTGGGSLPSGTEGQMLYNNAGTWTAFSSMYWDDTNSRLGIGTTGPSSKFQISAADGSDYTGAQMRIVETTNSKAIYVGTANSGAYALVQSVGAIPLILNPVGNTVAIGTNNPDTLKALHVVGNNGSDFLVEIESTQESANLLLLTDQATGKYAIMGFRRVTSGGDGWNFGMGSSSNNFVITSRVSSTNTDRFIISTGGNLGIGTTPETYTKMVVSSTYTTTTPNYGIKNSVTYTGGTTGTYYSTGLSSSLSAQVNSGITDSGEEVAGAFTVSRSGSSNTGTLATMKGIATTYGHYTGMGAGTTATAMGIAVTPYAQAGTITTAYDIYLAAAQTGGTLSTHWGLYQVDTSAKNYFGGSVGIGTNSVNAKLEVLSTATNTFRVSYSSSVYTEMHTDSSGYFYIVPTSSDKRVIIGDGATGKLDVGTVDPLYTINGTTYATYLPSMIGVKEEYTGIVNTQEYSNTEHAYAYYVDFEKTEELSVFYKITEFGSKWENLTILLTPASQSKVWYKKDVANKKLIIYTEEPCEVSFRLTANRFDYDKWKFNLGTEYDTKGFIINK